MMELQIEKKPDTGRTHSVPKGKPTKTHDIREIDYIGSGYQPPEKFASLAEKLSQAANETERVEAFTQLQQAYGNRYVQRILEAVAGGTNPEPDQKALSGTETLASAIEGVKTVLRPGYSPDTIRHVAPVPPLAEIQTAHDIIVPGGDPDVVEPAGDNSCTPSFGGTTLEWEVIADGEEWRPNVKSLTLAGTINIKPWANKPNEMVVPNTPNPVDGGNINDTEGSLNNWEYVIRDLEDYDTAGGGAGVYWHSAEASRAHEWAHWNIDWVQDAVNGSNGGDWLIANADIDDLRVSKADSGNTPAEGRAALEPLVNDRMRQWRQATAAYWNGTVVAVKDKPGAGGIGYAKGMEVLQGLIDKVRAYGTVLQGRGVLKRAAVAVGRLLGII